MTIPAPRFFRRSRSSPNGGWSALERRRTRDWESSYRDRWQHDRIVRSTHGVNCTGSCSWQVHVKQGIVTWETQQTDYPENGADVPDYEPRGCPRGRVVLAGTSTRRCASATPTCAAPCWSATARRWPRTGDPVEAWASIVDDPAARAAYTSQRGKGGLVRASWDEVADMVAAAHVHTIRRWGPDRVVGFSPIPAMSMASYSAGTRFFSLMGGVLTSFYDWYADLPPASPQVWGDQTDVPESADWWNATYLMMWGSNIPMTRTPDAHFMTEARYKGQKTVVVSPDYSDHTKFADHWLAAQPGTDGALALAMTHVILREFYVERETPYFADYARRFTDLPFLVTPRRARRRPRGRAPSSRPPTSARRARTPRPRPSSGTPPRARPAVPERLDRLPLGRRGRGALEPRPRGRGARHHADGRRRVGRRRPAALRRRRDRGRRGDAPRRPGAAHRRAPGHDGLRPAGRPARRGARRACPATGPPATTTPSPTRRPGRRRSPASTPSWSPASPASSPATPSAPTGAR